MATKKRAKTVPAEKKARKKGKKTVKSAKKLEIKGAKKGTKSTTKKVVNKISKKSKALKISKKDFKARLKSAFTPGSTFMTNLLWIFITVVALMTVDFFVQYINNDFSAAKVNNERITMNELEDRVMDRMADQILDEMIQERLILQAADEANVEVSNEEIEKEYKRIEKLSGGSEKLEAALIANGYTKDSYMDSLKLELLANAVLVDDPSEETLKEFFDTNKEVYFTTQDAYEDDKETVRRTYIQVEFQGKVSPWLTQIQDEAVVVNNIKEKPKYGFFLATRDSFTNIYNLITDKK